MPPAASLDPRREVQAAMVFEVVAETDFVLAIEPAHGQPVAESRLEVTLDGAPVDLRDDVDEHGTRLRLFETGAGLLEVRYAATLEGRGAAPATRPIDLVRALRPSRYVPSDTLTDFARETFATRDPATLVREVGAWVHDRLEYTAEHTSPTGGAVETLAAGAGVCRDFAHLTAALLRALDVPARHVSVYAPQLVPMDFHAVVEAWVDGRWVVIDATRLAPRRSMVRIATGRDAADTAWETNTLSDVVLRSIAVGARSDEALDDDPDELVELT
jgi:transglutaminase-like putative cysteine protease